MDPTCKQETIPKVKGEGGVGYAIWGLYSWKSLGVMVCLEMSVIYQQFVGTFFVEVHLLMSRIHADGLSLFQ